MSAEKKTETLDKEDAKNGKDVEMEDIEDHCRAEGHIKFEVKNVSKIKDTVLSDPVIIRNLPWYVFFLFIIIFLQ